MAKIVTSNIVSPLGFTSEDNFQAIMSGKSALKQYYDKWDLPEPFVASLFSNAQWEKILIDGYTRFESLVIYSITSAIEKRPVDLGSKRTALVLSTTKGNIDLLDEAHKNDTDILPGKTGKKIAKYFGITTEPVVVCNACVSGLCAIILATRLVDEGDYDNVIVCGADVIGKFVFSGFQSLKACSAAQCRPFDLERNGLNLGEAAATVVISNDSSKGCYGIQNAYISNDAYHLCTPSKLAEGCYKAIQNCVQKGIGINLSFIGVHGTATLYNDQMESIAIQRAGLSDVPVSAIKGFFGHTLGAAGVLETIIAIKSLQCGKLPSNRGYSEIGVSGNVNISPSTVNIAGNSCLKIMSGFGGCNAAVYISDSDIVCENNNRYEITHSVSISNQYVKIDGEELICTECEKDLITQLYKTYIGDYPKFYKMDRLSKLAFVASELLIKQDKEKKSEIENCSIILFNTTSSLHTDKKYFNTLYDNGQFLPSPSLFLYTLPNISTGEIAIRNNFHGETSFYILNDNKSKDLMLKIINTTLKYQDAGSAICGWVDYDSDENFFAELNLYKLK